MGTSTKMSDLGETIKLKNGPKLPEKNEEIKSVEFKKTDEEFDEIKVVKEIVKEVIQEAQKEIETSPSPPKPNKVYQSIYITSDNVKISNSSESPIGSFKVSKPDLVDYQASEGTHKLNTQPDIQTTTKPTDRNTGQLIRATTSVNGHARPLLKDQVPEPVNVGFALAAPQDEPWRPILPTRRVPSTTEPDVYDSLEEPIVPITFSKKVFDENLKVAPEFAEKNKPLKNSKLSKITEEIAKKYREILKQQSGLDSTTETEAITATTEKLTTTQVPPTVVVNPFKEPDDSRASSMLSFGLPELPIYEQFHHLDSLLKSFAGGTAAGGSPPRKNLTTTTESITTTKRIIRTTTQKAVDLKKPLLTSTPLPDLKQSTRFPLRRKPTTSNETIYVEVSTFTPGIKHRSDDNATTEKINAPTPKPFQAPTTEIPTSTQRTEPILIKGEVEVLDQPTSEGDSTTEELKLVTLLPVRSNVNMRTPLRPRPPIRRGRGQSHRFVDDEGGRRWVYYSSSKVTNPPEKLFIVTPEPVKPAFYNSIFDSKPSATSDIVQRIVQGVDSVAIAAENSSSVIVKVNSTVLKKAGKL